MQTLTSNPIIENNEVKEYFKVYLKVKGIKKRQRKVKPFHIEIAKTNDLNLPKLIPLGDKALDWCELNLKEVHSRMFLSFVVNQDKGQFTFECPFDDRNQLIDMSTINE